METLLAFDFSNKDDVKNFFAYIFSNKEARIVMVKIFMRRYDFICGINPRRVSEERKFVGFEKIISRLPVCDHETGEEMMELNMKNINKVEVLI